MPCLKQGASQYDAPSMTTRTPLALSDAIEIRSLDASHAQSFRTLRQNALREFPETFSLTATEERDTPWPDYLQRFEAEWISGDSVILGAFHQGELVGALGLRRWERQKLRHKSYIWVFFVGPAARRMGIGKRLFNLALQYARALTDLEQIQLSVSGESPSVRAIYVAFGFEPFGREQHALRMHGRFVDLELMMLYLH